MSRFDLDQRRYLVKPNPNESAEEYNQRVEEEIRLREKIYQEENRLRAEEQNREIREIRERARGIRETLTSEERKERIIRDADMQKTTRKMMQQLINRKDLENSQLNELEKQLILKLEEQQLKQKQLEQQQLKKQIEQQLAQQPQQQQPYSYNPISLLKGLKTRVSGLLSSKRVGGGSKHHRRSQKSQKSRRHSKK